MTLVTNDGTRAVDTFLEKKNPSGTEIAAFIANLDPLDFERNRKHLADALGIRAAALDDLRPRKVSKESSGQGRELALEDPEPWENHVDGHDVLDQVRAQIARFLIADGSSITAMTLWTAFSHLTDGAQISPLLTFSSTVKRCGKSTALEIVSRLVPRALPTANISASSLYRGVEKYHPTLLIDEADTIFKTDDILRTIVNSGFSRIAAVTIRCDGDSLEPRLFSTWCPKVLALIGRLPDTIRDRSIIIPMRRRIQSETVERLRADQPQGFDTLKRKLIRWTRDNADDIHSRDPEISSSFNDREADSWRELFKIADCAGGQWPDIARRAAAEITSKSGADDDDDVKTALLKDLAAYFDVQPNIHHHSSADLVEHLVGLDGSPWPEYRIGKPMTPNSLAKLLKGFGIKSKNVRTGGIVAKGYEIADFTDTFTRYLPINRYTQQSECNSILAMNYDCSGSDPVADSKRYKPLQTESVADSNRFSNAHATETLHSNSIFDNVLIGSVADGDENQDVPQEGNLEAECSRVADAMKLSPVERKRLWDFYGHDLPALLRRINHDADKLPTQVEVSQ